MIDAYGRTLEVFLNGVKVPDRTVTEDLLDFGKQSATVGMEFGYKRGVVVGLVAGVSLTLYGAYTYRVMKKMNDEDRHEGLE